MSEPTPESVDKDIDAFIDRFEGFDARLVARANPEVYITLSDKIAMFAIYCNQED